MDKNAIKKYAVWARRELIERVSQRALVYGITAKDAGDPNAESVNGHLLSQAEKRQRQALIRNIKEKGYEQVMEEVAYTWFNRFAALRFMEVNGYLPSHIRVFTNDAGEFKPQILAEAIHLELDGLDMNKVYELESANKSEELFKYLLIVQCNALNSILPGMFQRIEDYTELLLPDYLLREGSVIEQMVTTIPENDWTDQVQIIGWLYQYYNTEPKDKVFADLKKNIKITKENIPAATQLFTPDWIVHYMVENSLGRLWLEGHPNDALKSEWKYYLDEAEQEPEVQAQLSTIRKEYAALKPEEIRVIDPCMGSGHILCVLFDVLVRIYEDYGYTTREAAVKIVENNLWGLDIDERAAQLSYFAVMMKARQYDRRFLARKDEDGNPDVPQPHVYAIVESNHLDQFAIEYFCNGDAKLKAAMETIIRELHDAKEYGSILTVTPQDWSALYHRFDEIVGDIDLSREVALQQLLPLVRVAEVLAQKYYIAVTNPPYMGNMPVALNKLAQKNYSIYKYDAYALFIARMEKMIDSVGKMALVTGDSWLTLSSFDRMREDILSKMTITSLVGLGATAFECGFGTTAFIMRRNIANYVGCYIDIAEEIEKARILSNKEARKKKCYLHNESIFLLAPDKEIVYNISDREILLFSQEKLSSALIPKAGIVAGSNELYLRLWHEVNQKSIALDTKCGDDISNINWVPLHKGGGYRKYYGVHEYIIRLRRMLDDRSTNKSIRTGDKDFYFREGITWSTLSNKFGVRKSPEGFVYNTKGSMCFAVHEEQLDYIIGYLNSTVAMRLMKVIAPNLDFNSGTVVKIPFIYQANERVSQLVRENVSLSKADWDSFETSWDFQQHPLVALRGNYEEAEVTLYQDDLIDGIVPVEFSPVSSPIQQAYEAWERLCDKRFDALKANEEELNRIFIDIYGLQDELTPEVEDKDVTVRRADLGRDIRSFISYAVGCMFGRYSLDVPGLVYAGGEWDASKYTTYQPDKDAIIPICDDEYFADDIVGRFVKFVEVVYGKETLEENLRFIADALGGKGSSREVIRSYFINDFYADQLKVYQKRPIYWLFDSGKKNGFKCLVYMHRYQPDTIARIRTDYVHEQQSRYRTAIADLEQRINGASTSERVKLSKQLAKLQAQAEEVRVYEEKIHHLADQMIKIDLDDGVKHNYEIFKDVLAKIK